MDRAVDDVWLPADVFHDVNLTAVRPADRADVVAKHPERRPDSLAVRDLDACLDPSIGELALAGGL